MMKKVLAIILCLAMVFSLAACGGSEESKAPASSAPQGGESAAPAPAEAVTLRLSHSVAPTHAYHLGAERFAELVDEYTGGTVKIDIFPSAQLGDERANIEDLQMGTLDIAVTSTGPLGNFCGDFLVFDLPYLFESYEHAHAVLDGEIGQSMIDQLDDIGIVGGAFWENGFRNMTNSKKAINGPADCEGLKLRTMENQVHMDAYGELGMDPTPMAWSEVFTALQQGVIDGQENPTAIIYSNAVYEVQPYIALTQLVYSPTMLLFSKPVFDKLSADQQEAMLKAAKEAAAYERECIESEEASQLEEMEKFGCTITRPDVSEFSALMAPVYEKYSEQFGADFIDSIRNYEF